MTRRRKSIDEPGPAHELWFDPAQSRQPIRSVIAQGRLSELDQASQPKLTSETSWSRREDFWIPETVELYSRSPRWEERLQFALTWHSVNEPLQDSWFRREDLELPKGTQVGDRNLVDGIIVPDAILGTAEERSVPAARTRESPSYWLYFVLANLAVFGVLLGAGLRKRVR